MFTMSFECVTLSSDSSRPSSPSSDDLLKDSIQSVNPYSEGRREVCHEPEGSSPVKAKNNLFSLSDSDSDSNFKCVSSQDSITTDLLKSCNLGDVGIQQKRKKTAKISTGKGERRKIIKLAEKQTLQATKEFQRRLQPGECIKYVTAIIDAKIMQMKCMRNIEESLLEKEIKFTISVQHVQGSVVWTRERVVIQGQKGPTEKDEEERMLLCLSANEIIGLVLDGMLTSHVASIKDFFPEKCITLVLCGIEEYFKPPKNKKNSEVASSRPKVSRRCLEESLVNLQLVFGIGHRMVENSSELASLIYIFTKAVAEIPFKRDKQEREKSGVLNWFARGDSKDCVRVDSSGNGCLLLWRQQLRQFHNVGLDVAEAIASNYSSPQALLTAYKNCDSILAAEKLLQNIPVRRGCGPLSSIRRVGPELSRKIYTFFTSVDGNQLLSGS